MNNQDLKKKKKRQGFDFPTSDLASKTSSNCFKSAGGVNWSSSAPSIAIGTLTPEINSKY